MIRTLEHRRRAERKAKREEIYWGVCGLAVKVIALGGLSVGVWLVGLIVLDFALPATLRMLGW